MLSYTGRRAAFQDITNASDATTLSLADRLMNMSEKRILATEDWPFLEREDTTLTTVGGQQAYNMPALNGKFKSLYVNVSNFRWVPQEVTQRSEWDRLNLLSFKSDYPVKYYIFNGQIFIWPTPSTSGNTIGIIYKKLGKDITVADYSTGNITTATNGSIAIVGSGTAWTQQMQGRFLKITDANGANTGDGYWYEIGTVVITTTTLSLLKNYQGLSIAAGSAAYTIGQMSLLPEGYTDLSVFDAARQYFTSVQPDVNKVKLYDGLFKDLMMQMRDEQGDKSSNPVLDYGIIDAPITNPNLLVSSPGP